MGPPSISLSLTLVLIWWIYISTQLVAAQVVKNGQLFTNALAIVDAPTPDSNYQAGSTMSIAIDVSGNGKLSQSAQVPGSSLPTRFEGLQIFLISDYIGFNMTISDGNALLYQESGSTVKHLSWVIPSCTSSGSYNVTLYESSVINNEAYYTITTILIYIVGSSTGQCSGLNWFQVVQPSSPSPHSPWLTSQCSTGSYNPTSIRGQTTIASPQYTTTVLPQQSTAVSTHLTSLCSSCSSRTVTIQNYITQAKHPDSSTGGEVITASLPWISGDSGGTVILTVGEGTTEKTVSFVVIYTLTETFPGFTTTATMTISVTTEVEVPTNNVTYVGYIPVNSAKHLWMSAVATLAAGSLTIMTILTLLR